MAACGLEGAQALVGIGSCSQGPAMPAPAAATAALLMLAALHYWGVYCAWGKTAGEEVLAGVVFGCRCSKQRGVELLQRPGDSWPPHAPMQLDPTIQGLLKQCTAAQTSFVTCAQPCRDFIDQVHLGAAAAATDRKGHAALCCAVLRCAALRCAALRCAALLCPACRSCHIITARCTTLHLECLQIGTYGGIACARALVSVLVDQCVRDADQCMGELLPLRQMERACLPS